jgi:MFS family permease
MFATVRKLTQSSALTLVRAGSGAPRRLVRALTLLTPRSAAKLPAVPDAAPLAPLDSPASPTTAGAEVEPRQPMPTRASLNPFRVLVVHRNFRIFWLGQTLSLIGSWMQTMALGWLTLQLTNNAFYVGLVATVGSLPLLVLSLHAGVLVDRSDKLRTVTIAQSLLLLEAALLWWFTWTGQITIYWILALATFSGFVSAVEIPARQTLMVELVGREDLHEAIALNSSGFNLARIVGPGLGAFVIRTAGLAWCFGVNALSYLTVLIGLLMVKLPPYRPIAQTTSPLEGIRELWTYLRDTPEVKVLVRMVAVYSVLGVPYLTLMPVVARNVLRTGAGGFGGLLACVGIGGLSGALALAAIGGRVRRGRLLGVATSAFAVMLILFSLTRSVALAGAVLLVTGFAMIVNNALGNGLLQSLVPNHLRGRLMALYSLIVVGLSQVVGSFLAGVLARVVGPEWAIGGGAALMLAYTLYAFWRHPEITKL